MRAPAPSYRRILHSRGMVLDHPGLWHASHSRECSTEHAAGVICAPASGNDAIARVLVGAVGHLVCELQVFRTGIVAVVAPFGCGPRRVGPSEGSMPPIGASWNQSAVLSPCSTSAEPILVHGVIDETVCPSIHWIAAVKLSLAPALALNPTGDILLLATACEELRCPKRAGVNLRFPRGRRRRMRALGSGRLVGSRRGRWEKCCEEFGRARRGPGVACFRGEGRTIWWRTLKKMRAKLFAAYWG